VVSGRRSLAFNVRYVLDGLRRGAERVELRWQCPTPSRSRWPVRSGTLSVIVVQDSALIRPTSIAAFSDLLRLRGSVAIRSGAMRG